MYGIPTQPAQVYENYHCSQGNSKTKKLAMTKIKRTSMVTLIRGVIKLQMAVMATIITIRLLAIPAATDASPNTIAPTMLSACPTSWAYVLRLRAAVQKP